MSQFIEMFKEAPQIKLGNLATFVNGSAFKPEDWGEKGVPIVRIQNLTGSGEAYNRFDGDTSNKIIIVPGDILVSWSATLGVYIWKGETALLNQHIFKAELNKVEIDKDFFIYTVRTALSRMGENAHGSTMKHVVKKDFDNTLVAYPTIYAQKQFSAIYKQADKSEFDGFKSQFIEMFGDQNTNERCWEDSFIKELFSLSMGKTPARNRPDYWQQSSNKWISISDMAKYNRYTGDTDETISDIAVKETGIKKVPKGTIIMSFKLSIGRTAITSEDIYTNEAIMAFQDVDTNKFDISFLYYLIANKNWLYNAKQAVKGQTLNKESIGNSKIIVPPIALQKQFANILIQADKSESGLQSDIAA